MSESTRVDPEVTWEGADLLRPHLVPIGEIKPHERNPRRGAVSKLMESLQRWGQVRAVLTDPDGNIIAGHHVTQAAQRLGWTHVAVIPHAFRDQREADAYLIADNALQEAGVTIHAGQGDLLGKDADLTGTGLEEADITEAFIRRRTDWVSYTELKAHPRNNRHHPQEQIDHMVRSLEENGFYRNIVAARDGTILAGHGLWTAARRKGIVKLPVTFLDCEPESPEALKVLVTDNKVGHLADEDDRALSEILREVAEGDSSRLVGTGYDAQMLANLVLTTRPKSEIQDHDHAAEWVGMADFETPGKSIQLLVSFEDAEGREEFVEHAGLKPHIRGDVLTWSAWWPVRERQDLSSVYFDIDGQTTIDDFVDAGGASDG